GYATRTDRRTGSASRGLLLLAHRAPTAERRTGTGAHVTRRHRLGAVGTGEHRHHGVTATTVLQLDGRSGVTRHPAIAPARHRDDDRVEVAALLGEPILEARRPVLVSKPLHHVRVDETLQAIGQPVTREADGLEVLEPPHAQERVAQDQERPAIADHGQRPRHRAGEVSDVSPAHWWVPKRNLLAAAGPSLQSR